jgi:Na+/H+-dicarboxylate symporter
VTTPALAAIATGDVYFAVAVLVRTQHESMRVPRRVGGMVMPVVAIVGRAGTALVGIAAFLVVIRSYTALEIEFREVAGLTLVAFAIAFLLGRYPASGVLVTVAYLATRYGRGMEEAYLVLLPVGILLQRVAAFLDLLTVGFLVEVIARTENGSRRPEGATGRGAPRRAG